jgi:hypothetical protein
MTVEQLSLTDWHKKQAVHNFNATWDLMEKENRTQEEDFQMIHTAHASRFHWGEIGTPLEFSRGEWQISRVYSLLGRFESAQSHAKYCLELCELNQIGDFDYAFAHEALARAYKAGNDLSSMEKHLKLAYKAAEDISEEGDRNYLLSELKSLEE